MGQGGELQFIWWQWSEQSDSDYILKVEPTGFPAGLDVQCENYPRRWPTHLWGGSCQWVRRGKQDGADCGVSRRCPADAQEAAGSQCTSLDSGEEPGLGLWTGVSVHDCIRVRSLEEVPQGVSRVEEGTEDSLGSFSTRRMGRREAGSREPGGTASTVRRKPGLPSWRWDLSSFCHVETTGGLDKSSFEGVVRDESLIRLSLRMGEREWRQWKQTTLKSFAALKNNNKKHGLDVWIHFHQMFR